MAQINKVMKSCNGFDDSTCVDIFQQPDGSFGFEEYRRDIEDNRGWFPIGHHTGQVFSSESEALTMARKSIVWFSG